MYALAFARSFLLTFNIKKMKNLIKVISALSATLALCSCETPEKEVYTRGLYVDTIPAGMEIVVDGLKVGKAPLTVEFESTDDGYFTRKTVLTAIPTRDKLNTQIKTFPAHRADNSAESRIPEKIVFDLTKAPTDTSAVIME